MKARIEDGNSSTVALQNGLELVRRLSDEGPMTSEELAQSLSLRSDTTAKLLKTLEMHGFVEPARFAKRFQPGRMAGTLSEKFLGDTPVTDIARPVLQALADQHDGIGTLVVADRDEALLLVTCSGPTRQNAHECHVGSTYPLPFTAGGHALLFTMHNAADEPIAESGYNEVETRALEESFAFFCASGCFRTPLPECDLLLLGAPLHLSNAVLALELAIPDGSGASKDTTAAVKDLLSAVELIQRKCSTLGVRYLEDS